ncbi:unnamed protein product, partial [Closterium sp. NIES-54]
LQEEFWRKKLTAAAREGGGSAYGMKGFKGCGSKKGKAKEGSEGSSIMMGSVATKEASGVAATVGIAMWKLTQAMGEGMGSEEGDGGAGGHGGMFYHVGVACSEDMVVPARKVALHRSSHWVINTGAFMTMTNREDLLDEARPSKAATVVSATGQVVPVRGEGRAMFIGADGRLVGLKLVILVPGLCANLLSTKALSEAGMKMEMMGTKVFKATLDGRVLWDLRGGKDMHQSMWEIPVLPWKEAAARLAAEAVRGGHASHVTSGGGGDGSDGGLLVHGGGALPSVTPSTGQHWIPMEKWSGKKPLVDMLRIFGCMRLVHVPKERRDKLQAAVVWAVHLGLARGSKGWLMWDPKSKPIFTTRDAKFMEGLMFKEWSERGRSKVTIPLGIEVGTNDPLLIPINFSSSSELTEVSHDLGGAEGEAADVEEVMQQGKAPAAESLVRSGVAIFDLEYEAILSAMYALSASAEGDCYWCVPPDPRIAATTLGASESSLPSTAPAEALHTFTLNFTLFLSSLPPLPPSPAPPCLSCVEGQQRAAPHSSSFPLTTAPLQTLHMDVWGPARVIGQGRERYFLLVFDDYTWYTTVFPLRSNGQVVDVLIPLIRAVRLPLRERFRADLSVLRHHSDRGGEFSSDLLWNFCRGECILQSFSLLDSPQKNGIAEHRIGLVMEVARTSMIHAIAPDYLWPFAVGYAANQLNLWPRVSFPETSLILGWTGKVHDTSADKLSARAIPCAAMDAKMASWKSTGTYVDEVPPPGANIVDGMRIFKVKRPPGYPPAFKARYVARGFSQQQSVYFQTFSPTPKMTTLRVLLHVAAQRDYELHSLDFSTAFLQGSLHEEILLRRPPGFTGSFPAGTQWSLRRPVYGLH